MLSTICGRVVNLWRQKWRLRHQADCDFNNDFGYQLWVVRVGIALLVPSC